MTLSQNGKWKDSLMGLFGSKVSWMAALVILCNVVVVMTVNFSFVYTVANNTYTDANQVSLLSIALSCFKLAWNRLLLLGTAVRGLSNDDDTTVPLLSTTTLFLSRYSIIS